MKKRENYYRKTPTGIFINRNGKPLPNINSHKYYRSYEGNKIRKIAH